MEDDDHDGIDFMQTGGVIMIDDTDRKTIFNDKEIGIGISEQKNILNTETRKDAITELNETKYNKLYSRLQKDDLKDRPGIKGLLKSFEDNEKRKKKQDAIEKERIASEEKLRASEAKQNNAATRRKALLNETVSKRASATAAAAAPTAPTTNSLSTTYTTGKRPRQQQMRRTTSRKRR
jgi:hypothetical protein